MCRLAWVLPRPSRGTPVASAFIQATVTKPAELLCSQPRPSNLVAIRSLCDRHGLAREEESNFSFKRTPLDKQVSSAKSPEEVLQLWGALGGTANQAAMCLTQVSRLALDRSAEERRQLMNDPSCATLLNTVSSQVRAQNYLIILSRLYMEKHTRAHIVCESQVEFSFKY